MFPQIKGSVASQIEIAGKLESSLSLNGREEWAKADLMQQLGFSYGATSKFPDKPKNKGSDKVTELPAFRW